LSPTENSMFQERCLTVAFTIVFITLIGCRVQNELPPPPDANGKPYCEVRVFPWLQMLDQYDLEVHTWNFKPGAKLKHKWSMLRNLGSITKDGGEWRYDALEYPKSPIVTSPGLLYRTSLGRAQNVKR
jgi:hypothetical protein